MFYNSQTCLFRTRSSPGVNPVSFFCVDVIISSRSFTGGISPFAIERKYLTLKYTVRFTSVCLLIQQPDMDHRQNAETVKNENH